MPGGRDKTLYSAYSYRLAFVSNRLQVQRCRLGRDSQFRSATQPWTLFFIDRLNYPNKAHHIAANIRPLPIELYCTAAPLAVIAELRQAIYNRLVNASYPCKHQPFDSCNRLRHPLAVLHNGRRASGYCTQFTAPSR